MSTSASGRSVHPVSPPSSSGRNPPGEFQQGDLSPESGVHRAHVRRRAAEYHHGVLSASPFDGHVAGVIAGRGRLLLVRPLLLFVYDNQANVRHGRERGAPRADDDIKLTLRDAPPFVIPLPQRQSAVKHRNATGKSLPEAADGLRRQRDLRHEHDAPPALLNHAPERLQIHLRLAAPRHAVQQINVGRAVIDARRHVIERVLLVGSELEIRRRRSRVTLRKRITSRLALLQGDYSGLRKRIPGPPRRPGNTPQVR